MSHQQAKKTKTTLHSGGSCKKCWICLNKHRTGEQTCLITWAFWNTKSMHNAKYQCNKVIAFTYLGSLQAHLSTLAHLSTFTNPLKVLLKLNPQILHLLIMSLKREQTKKWHVKEQRKHIMMRFSFSIKTLGHQNSRAATWAALNLKWQI